MLFLEIVLVLSMYLYFYIKSRKALHMLQQNSYNENNRYLIWIKDNFLSIFAYYDPLLFLFIFATYYVNNSNMYRNIFMILSIAFTFVLSNYVITKSRKEQSKKPLVVTKRIKRLDCTLFILFMLPVIFVLCGLINKYIMFAILEVEIFLVFFMIFIAYFINKPVEKLVTLKYLNMAKKKLSNMPHLEVVGITGSYGKTSSKNIISDILSIKYITKPSPGNLNTYLGIMTTINNNLDKFDEIFVAEMGAYARGDIKQLCDFVHPKYGILTRIGEAHLSSFGSLENIQKGKFELIESLPEDGIAILNKDDKMQTSYDIKSNCKKVWIGIDDNSADYVAYNIKCNSKGTQFKLKIKGKKETYDFETKLLGYLNVYNILAGIALGDQLGISMKNLIMAVHGVKPVEHRLEIKKISNFYMIDDSYNSNPLGSSMACDILSMMDGYHVVVTPGMIELGELEEKCNFEFGEKIASTADYVILVGSTKTKPIYDGLISKGFDKDNIMIINDVKESFEVLNRMKEKNIYALFENDLPDMYNEKN